MTPDDKQALDDAVERVRDLARRYGYAVAVVAWPCGCAVATKTDAPHPAENDHERHERLEQRVYAARN